MSNHTFFTVRDVGELLAGGKLPQCCLPLLVLTCCILYFQLSQKRRRRRTVNKSPAGFGNLPGPRLYPFGGYLNMLEMRNKQDILPLLEKWYREYGDAYRLKFGPTEAVVLSSPEHVQKLCCSMDSQHWKKPFTFDIAKPVPWFDGILHSSGEKWKSRRKLIGPIMKYNSLLAYTSIFNDESIELVQTLDALFNSDSSSAEAAAPKPIQSVLFGAALSGICKAALGPDSGDIVYNKSEWLHHTQRFMEIIAIRMASGILIPDPIFRLHPLAKELDKGFTATENIIRQILKQYEEADRRRGTISDSSRRESSSSSSLLFQLYRAGLPFEGMYEEVLTMVTAGFETTGGALHNLLFLLALHPEQQEVCREEVDKVFADPSNLTPNGTTTLTSHSLKRLGALERCILETLRLIPAAYVLARRIDSELTLSNELVLPGGTNVLLYLKGIQMNPSLYLNPQVFDPDRHLPEVKKTRHSHAFTPFSSGPRVCIGRRFAMMELTILSARILRHFVIRTTTRLEDVVFLPCFTLLPETPMEFVLERRTVDGSL